MIRRLALAAVLFIGGYFAATAQQTQLLWGYLAGSPSHIQFKSGANWYDIGTFNGTSFTPIGGGGSVSSVGLTMPALFTVTGSPVTGTGTLAASFANQTAHAFLAGPTSGGAAAPTMRAVIPTDLPTLVGDGGAGGTAGIAPAPGAGTAAQGQVLTASGSWAKPASFLVDAVKQCGADPLNIADSTSAINNCLVNYGAVGLPPGTYKTTGAINVGTKQTLCGSGDGSATISLNSTTAVGIVVAANADSVTLCDLHVTRVGVPVGAAYGIATDTATIITQSSFRNLHVENHAVGFVLGPTDYSYCEWCLSEKNYGDGFYFTNNATWNIVQWNMRFCLSQKNDGWGYQFVGVASTPPPIQGIPWVAIQSYANTNGGVRFISTAGVPINGITLHEPVLSYDGNNELEIQAFDGRYVKIDNGYIEGAGQDVTGRTLTTPASGLGSGISILNGIGDVTIAGNTIETNSHYGVAITGAATSILVDHNHFIRNSNVSANTYDGITVDGTSITKLTVTNNVAFDDLSPTQRYGLSNTVAATSTIIAGNNMTGVTAGCTLSTSAIIYGNSGVGCGGPTIASTVLVASAVSLTTSVAANITSVSLPAGDWTCTGNVDFYPAGTTTIAAIAGWIGTTSAAVPTRPNSGAFAELTATLTTGSNNTLPVGSITFTVGTTTTVYLEAYSAFGTSTMKAGGYIGCRRAL